MISPPTHSPGMFAAFRILMQIMLFGMLPVIVTAAVLVRLVEG